MSAKHINANKGDFAKTVIMPGDPLRAKYIAETFLQGARLVTDVRGMLGFTGEYRGKALSVMAHGMGIPSASIYCTELVTEFGVEEMIRVGSCGAVHDDISLRDIIIGMGASTDSNVNRMRFKGYDFAAIADFGLLRKAVDVAERQELPVRVGNVFSADLFYTPEPEMFDVLEKYNVYGVDMEAAGIYGVAAEFGVKALTILTVSDHIRTGAALSSDERMNSFNEMIQLALEAAIS
ncbi:purine-nucleoside phosphorylase [Pseudomaricurvus alkylphenolicus]|uniref:purine-nucleoside phosphorylase n=1 Tax=Pseudomaricurvus alkylphenolicus TaxID=1306991 RepID=UPI0014222792|nr:purine-nucleoside phosphorylase [Pseudomaricurvus alkylphenolicus]NIB42398.1 purine-nucleoside phosphorylase [Pseudomaricurvus alkylphenolicus]